MMSEGHRADDGHDPNMTRVRCSLQRCLDQAVDDPLHADSFVPPAVRLSESLELHSGLAHVAVLTHTVVASFYPPYRS